MEKDPYKYPSICMGEVTVPKMDDGEELENTQESFEVLEFSPEVIDGIFKIACGILHFQCMTFKKKQREEQGEIDGTEAADKAAYLFGINSADMGKYLCSPRVRVGNEVVTKGQTPEQISYNALEKCKN